MTLYVYCCCVKLAPKRPDRFRQNLLKSCLLRIGAPKILFLKQEINTDLAKIPSFVILQNSFWEPLFVSQGSNCKLPYGDENVEIRMLY